MKSSLGLFVWSMVFLSCDGRPAFVSRIPNGNEVTGVVALGHMNTGGGGALNAFGRAFANAGRVWTTALCQEDSDNDGATNGEELGDPCCKWSSSTGFATSATMTPTHPGVANSFSAAQLAAMTCAGEADLDSLVSSVVDSSISSASAVADSSGSSSSSVAVGDDNDNSSGLNNLLNPEGRPSLSPVPRTTEVVNTGTQLSYRIAAWMMAFTTVLALCL